MKYIELTQGKIAIVDDDVYDFLSTRKWRVMYTLEGKFYAVSGSGKETVLMQKVIMKPPKGMQVYHLSQNSLDNRRDNLRNCTISQIRSNRKKFKNNSSGYKGVYWNKSAKKWHAQIRFNNKQYYIGLFEDLKEAACAYDYAAMKLHGDFARLNFAKVTADANA